MSQQNACYFPERPTRFHDCSCKKFSRFYAGRVHDYIDKKIWVFANHFKKSPGFYGGGVPDYIDNRTWVFANRVNSSKGGNLEEGTLFL